MSHSIQQRLLALAFTASLPFSAQAHFDDSEPLQSYRQSYFALVATNFGPIAAMVKGDMPWNDSSVKTLSSDLEALSKLDLMRGFAAGSEQGHTRAKADIWENMEDFKARFEDFQQAASALASSAATGEREAIAKGVAAVGKSCKSCHDNYKSKNYLY